MVYLLIFILLLGIFVPAIVMSGSQGQENYDRAFQEFLENKKEKK